MHQNLIDQLNVFLAVVEAGSLSGAARKLGRAVSTVSYAIDRLEAQYGLDLFKRDIGKFRLTKQGKELLREAELALEGARRFEARAHILKTGAESVLRIGVDLLFPHNLLVESLKQFSRNNPQVEVRIFVTSLNRSWQELLEGQIDFSLAPLRRLPPNVEKKPLVAERLIVVASPEHPLAKYSGPIPLEELRKHRQLYYATPDVDIELQGRIFSSGFWTGSDLRMILLLVYAGIGWCFVTPDWAQPDIRDGRLIELPLTDMLSDGVWTFGSVWQIDSPPGILGSEFLSIVEGFAERYHNE